MILVAAPTFSSRLQFVSNLLVYKNIPVQLLRFFFIYLFFKEGIAQQQKKKGEKTKKKKDEEEYVTVALYWPRARLFIKQLCSIRHGRKMVAENNCPYWNAAGF